MTFYINYINLSVTDKGQSEVVFNYLFRQLTFYLYFPRWTAQLFQISKSATSNQNYEC
jgi:hypothetical protein